MGIAELFLIAVGLSMDAFAVSVCKGLANQDIKAKLQKSVIVGLYFGLFQAVMPLIGYIAGSQFSERIESFDHWIVFILLAIIGGKMIWDSFKDDNAESESNSDVGLKTMIPLAFATSIDALATGITFSFLHVNIVYAVSFIGITTFLLCIVGYEIGKVLGNKFSSKAKFAGGAVLILIGAKVLLEHIGIINF